MRTSSKKEYFFAALLVISIATLVIAIFSRSEIVKMGLRWIEFLSNVPGLSGLLLLIIFPGLFLLGCLAVKWLSQYFNA